MTNAVYHKQCTDGIKPIAPINAASVRENLVRLACSNPCSSIQMD
jgi:hypothetical protein